MVGLIYTLSFPKLTLLFSSTQVIPNHSGLGAVRDSEWPHVLQVDFLLVNWTSFLFTFKVVGSLIVIRLLNYFYGLNMFY